MRSLFLPALDGTLLRSDRTIGERTLDSLERLAERQVVRVVATGRSLHSVLRVLAIRRSASGPAFPSARQTAAWRAPRYTRNIHSAIVHWRTADSAQKMSTRYNEIQGRVVGSIANP